MNEKSLYAPIPLSIAEAEACPVEYKTSLQYIQVRRAHLWTAKVVIVALTVLNIACALVLYYKSSQVLPGRAQQAVRIDPIHGQIPLVPVVFNSNETFVEDNPMSPNTIWSEILAVSEKSATIPVPHADFLGLSGGMPPSNGSKHEGYGTSMFHQLHCLAAIKSELMYYWEHVGEVSLSNHVIEAQQHMKHCIEYIRQGIMCAGDLTPEKALIDGDFYNGPTPWGAEHTCVDFQAVRKGVLDNLFKGYLAIPVDEVKRAAFLKHKQRLVEGKTFAIFPPE